MCDPKKEKVKVLPQPQCRATVNFGNWGVKEAKFPQRTGNFVKLLNCGEDYLPELKKAIENAKHTIYITSWGFSHETLLSLDDEDSVGALLRKKLKEGVKIKILVWAGAVLNSFPNYNDFDNIHADFCKIKGKTVIMEIIDLVYKAEDYITQSTYDEMKKLNDYFANDHLNKSYHQKLDALLMFGKKGAEALDSRRKTAEKKKSGYISKQNVPPSYHQKTILIDIGTENAVGFVQGFNLKPEYFGKKSHPYSEGKKYQDTGLVFKGPCLEDLYSNFSEVWNKAVDKRGKKPSGHNGLDLTKVSEKSEDEDNLVKERPDGYKPQSGYNFPKTKAQYTCQILRTWKGNDEADINDFYLQAFAYVNEFIYIEDQYFRQPEFAEAIMKRGKAIKKNCKGNKLLHVFVVTNMLDHEVNSRIDTLNEIGRGDLMVDEGDYSKRISKKSNDKTEEMKKIQDKMIENGVKVQICVLKHSETQRKVSISSDSGQGKTINVYRNIKIHSKLTIFDNACLTLGSANWNFRSMFGDPEVNIAVAFDSYEKQGNDCSDFREDIWSNHTNGLWESKKEDGKKTTPSDWYEQWETLLKKNFLQYRKKELLKMNLFPYYEKLSKKKWADFS